MSQGIGARIRRLPVYLLLDCSSSMAGRPIEAIRRAVHGLISDLTGDPQSLETAWVSVITFGGKAEQIIPLTELPAFVEPPLQASGVAVLGEALQLLIQCINREVRKSTAAEKGDWKPLIFIMTDSQPGDDWEQLAEELKQMKIANIIACTTTSEAGDRVVRRITDTIVRLDLPVLERQGCLLGLGIFYDFSSPTQLGAAVG